MYRIRLVRSKRTFDDFFVLLIVVSLSKKSPVDGKANN